MYELKGQLSMRGSFKALHIHGKGGRFFAYALIIIYIRHTKT